MYTVNGKEMSAEVSTYVSSQLKIESLGSKETKELELVGNFDGQEKLKEGDSVESAIFGVTFQDEEAEILVSSKKGTFYTATVTQ